MNATSFYIDQPKPDGEWIGWRAWFELSGSHHYGAEVALFAREASKTATGTFSTVEREPDNRFDRHAIAVFGHVGQDKWKLGFVPKGEARDLSAFPSNMPMATRTISIRFVGDSVYVRVQLLVPSKKARKAHGWEPKPS